MKKTIYAIAALAFAFIGCTKEYNETFAPGDKLVIRAEVNDALTKVAADNAGSFSWQAGDAITVLNTSGDAFNLTTATEGAAAAFTTDSFEGTLSTEAFYPASTSHKSGKFFLEPTFTWKDGETFMPMIGTVNTSTKKVSFKTAGAVIKLVCYNVADNARKLVVSSDTKKLSGEFTPSAEAIVAAAMGASDNTITINFAAGHPSTMVFYIPVPTGDLGKLSFVVKDDSDANVSNVQTTKGNITMERQHMVAAPAMNCSGGEILWSEDFSDYDSGDVPSGSVAKGFGGANVTYACTDGGSATKIYSEALAAGSSPELLVGKSTGCFQVSDIPTNGKATMALSFQENYDRITVSSSTDGVTITGGSFNSVSKQYTCTVNNSKNAAKIDLKFANTAGSNVRLDDIVLTAPGTAFVAPTINPVKDALEIDANGGDASTTFTYSGALDSNPVVASVEAGASWLTASIEGSTLTVSAGKNTSSSRSAKVTLRATGVSKVITVSQESASTEAEVSISDYASAHSWENGTQYLSVSVDSNITATVSGGGNTGKYYTSGKDWRLYQTESASLTISAKTGLTIDEVTITYNSSNSGVLKNGSSNVSSGTKVSVGGESITLNVGNTGSATNGQVKITAINVVYH